LPAYVKANELAVQKQPVGANDRLYHVTSRIHPKAFTFIESYISSGKLHLYN
jgi:hypothetical protein